MLRYRHVPLLPRRHFLIHLLKQASIGVGIIAGSLGIGAAGYRWTEGWPWIDAVLNASMILAGMGPVNPVQTNAGKIFATLYALFSGVVFLTTVALLLAPVLHRFLHQFHLEFAEEENETHIAQRSQSTQRRETNNHENTKE